MRFLFPWRRLNQKLRQQVLNFTTTISSEQYLKENWNEWESWVDRLKSNWSPWSFCFCSCNVFFCFFCCIASAFLSNREGQSSQHICLQDRNFQPDQPGTLGSSSPVKRAVDAAGHSIVLCIRHRGFKALSIDFGNYSKELIIHKQSHFFWL